MAQQQITGMKQRGMGDSDSESEDGFPPGLQGIPGLPPISGPVVTATAPRPVSGDSDRSGPDSSPQPVPGMSQMTGPEMATPRVESPSSRTDTQTGTEMTSVPPTVQYMPVAGGGYSVIPRETTESQIYEVRINTFFYISNKTVT